MSAKPASAAPASEKSKPVKSKPAKARTAKSLADKSSADKSPGVKSLAGRLNAEKLMSVLIGPHLSEKSSGLAERLKQFVFKVRRDADKSDVKRAVELMFDVKVTAVQVVNCMGKAKRFGRSPGRRQDWKKAYVTLAEGQDIDFLGAQ
jgi:large subunit ribosomal protein L23